MGNDYFFPSLPPPSGFPSIIYDVADQDDYTSSKIHFEARVIEMARYPPALNSLPKLNRGNALDLVSFLSHDDRDFLFRNDKIDTIIQVASLRDKRWIMICCFFCPIYSNSPDAADARALACACSELYEDFGKIFEIVLVFKMRVGFQSDENTFKHMLTGFPPSCLVVPFSDSLSRDRICCSLNLEVSATGLLFCAEKKSVIWRKSLCFFRSYGKDAFPFTDADFCYHQHKVFTSLNDILCCSPCSILCKNLKGPDGREIVVSLEQLEKKTVLIYLCLSGEAISVIHLYEHYRNAIGKPIEVVIVYLPFLLTSADPQVFQHLINKALERRKISWWVLPFKNWVSRMLTRIDHHTLFTDEVILVDGGHIHAYALESISQYANQFRDILSPPSL